MVIFWMIIPSLICLNAFLAWQIQKTNEKWLRLFAEKQGIPLNILEGKEEKPPAPPAPKKKVRAFTMPIPGAGWIREARRKAE